LKGRTDIPSIRGAYLGRKGAEDNSFVKGEEGLTANEKGSSDVKHPKSGTHNHSPRKQSEEKPGGLVAVES